MPERFSGTREGDGNADDADLADKSGWRARTPERFCGTQCQKRRAMAHEFVLIRLIRVICVPITIQTGIFIIFE